MLEVLQVAWQVILWLVPVLLLVKVSEVTSMEQVLHLDLPQGAFPGVAREGGVSSARTRRSRRLLGRRYAMRGGDGMALLILLESWSRGW